MTSTVTWSKRRFLTRLLQVSALTPALSLLPLSIRAEETFPLTLSEEEWRERLSDEEFEILREAGTEPPGSSPLLKESRKGTFVCAGCEQKVFGSETKYDSGTGWPSFWAPIEGKVVTRPDNTLFMKRTEVVCGRCGGHLGHVFDDGPPPTGKRWCINGVALDFVPTNAAGAS